MGADYINQCVQKYDCVFISETWTNDISNIELEGYQSLCKHRVNIVRVKRYSGGIVVYIRNEMVKGVKVEEWAYEDGICLVLSKDVLGFAEDMFLLCVYMRSKESTREGMNVDLNCYDLLEEQIARVRDQGGMIVMGDMNARTGDKLECVVVDDSYVCNEREIDTKMHNVPVDPMITMKDMVEKGMGVCRVNSDKKTPTDYGNKLINMATGGT